MTAVVEAGVKRTGFGFDPDETLQEYPASGESAIIDGVMVRLPSDSRRVWLISDGKRHIVPSENVVELLGGWELVLVLPRREAASSSARETVDKESVEEVILSSTEQAKAPISAEGRMIRETDNGKIENQIWVIHDRQRHLITNESGIHKRGGWQRVALVRPEVLEWFPDSGTPAR
jgi:hypothetical protein